jgi:hypothetical protein
MKVVTGASCLIESKEAASESKRNSSGFIFNPGQIVCSILIFLSSFLLSQFNWSFLELG